MVYGLFRVLLKSCSSSTLILFFFFNDTATTEIYTLSLHDALPIWSNITTMPLGTPISTTPRESGSASRPTGTASSSPAADRESTTLKSSHRQNFYAVFLLEKKESLHLVTVVQRRVSLPTRRQHCAG